MDQRIIVRGGKKPNQVMIVCRSMALQHHNNIIFYKERVVEKQYCKTESSSVSSATNYIQSPVMLNSLHHFDNIIIRDNEPHYSKTIRVRWTIQRFTLKLFFFFYRIVLLIFYTVAVYHLA